MKIMKITEKCWEDTVKTARAQGVSNKPIVKRKREGGDHILYINISSPDIK